MKGGMGEKKKGKGTYHIIMRKFAKEIKKDGTQVG